MNEPQLSESQRICLRLVGAGMSSKEIAIERGLTPRTVDQYITLAVQSLGASNRRDAARKLAQLEAEPHIRREKTLPSHDPTLEISTEPDAQQFGLSANLYQLDDKNNELEKLQLEPGSIDPAPISATNDRVTPAANKGLRQRLAGWIPPLGGARDDLSEAAKILQIAKAAAVAAIAFIAIVGGGAWLQSIISYLYNR